MDAKEVRLRARITLLQARLDEIERVVMSAVISDEERQRILGAWEYPYTDLEQWMVM